MTHSIYEIHHYGCPNGFIIFVVPEAKLDKILYGFKPTNQNWWYLKPYGLNRAREIFQELVNDIDCPVTGNILYKSDVDLSKNFCDYDGTRQFFINAIYDVFRK